MMEEVLEAEQQNRKTVGRDPGKRIRKPPAKKRSQKGRRKFFRVKVTRFWGVTQEDHDSFDPNTNLPPEWFDAYMKLSDVRKDRFRQLYFYKVPIPEIIPYTMKERLFLQKMNLLTLRLDDVPVQDRFSPPPGREFDLNMAKPHVIQFFTRLGDRAQQKYRNMFAWGYSHSEILKGFSDPFIYQVMMRKARGGPVRKAERKFKDIGGKYRELLTTTNTCEKGSVAPGETLPASSTGTDILERKPIVPKHGEAFSVKQANPVADFFSYLSIDAQMNYKLLSSRGYSHEAIVKAISDPSIFKAMMKEADGKTTLEGKRVFSNHGVTSQPSTSNLAKTVFNEALKEERYHTPELSQTPNASKRPTYTKYPSDTVPPKVPRNAPPNSGFYQLDASPSKVLPGNGLPTSDELENWFKPFVISVAHALHPRKILTSNQMSLVEQSILDALLDVKPGESKPSFFHTHQNHNHGLVVFYCNNEATVAWLWKIIPHCKPWRDAWLTTFAGMNETCCEALAILPSCAGDEHNKILQYIDKQNENLNVSKWKILDSETNFKGTVRMKLLVDLQSAEVLNENPSINFKFGRGTIEVKYRGEDQIDQSLTQTQNHHLRSSQQTSFGNSGGVISYDQPRSVHNVKPQLQRQPQGPHNVPPYAHPRPMGRPQDHERQGSRLPPAHRGDPPPHVRSHQGPPRFRDSPPQPAVVRERFSAPRNNHSYFNQADSGLSHYTQDHSQLTVNSEQYPRYRNARMEQRSKRSRNQEMAFWAPQMTPDYSQPPGREMPPDYAFARPTSSRNPY